MSTETFIQFKEGSNGIGTIEGESKPAGFEKWSDVLSWSQGMSNHATTLGSGGHGTGKADFADLNIMKAVDKASIKLWLACASGSHFKEVVMTQRRSGGKQVELIKITLSEAVITSISHSGSSEHPMESVSIGYKTIKVDYTPQKNDGSADTTVKTGWNRETNVKV